MNYDVVILDNLRVLQIQNIQTRTARKIVRVEKFANVRSQKTAAAGNENFHKFILT